MRQKTRDEENTADELAVGEDVGHYLGQGNSQAPEKARNTGESRREDLIVAMPRKHATQGNTQNERRPVTPRIGTLTQKEFIHDDDY